MSKIAFVLLFLLSFAGHPQRTAAIEVDGDVQKISFADTLQLAQYIRELQLSWIGEGFLFCGVDTAYLTSQGVQVTMYRGKKYSTKKARNIYERAKPVLDQLINEGRPFAQVGLDSLRISDEGDFNGKIIIEKGPEIRLDAIQVSGDVPVKQVYLSRLLELKPNELFSERQYSLAAGKIARSPFLALKKPTDIAFQDGKATVFLDLSARKTNEFEGVMGLQQNRLGQSTVVGSLRLDTDNLFQAGHQLHFFWERFAGASQTLNLHYRHAFLFGSVISPTVQFELIKQDSSFLNQTTRLGIDLFLAKDLKLVADVESIHASLISTDMEAIQSQALADYTRRLYGLSMSQGHLPTFDTPKKGRAWRIFSSVGRKRVDKNSSLSDAYYDTIPLNTNFLKMEGMLAYQLNLTQRRTIFHHISVANLFNDALLTNELYRLGGLYSIRGFNEKSFFAQGYVASRLELRSFFESDSYFYGFYDQLLYYRSGSRQAPFGFGLGFSLILDAGRFNFALASGISDQQSLAFEQLRIHFGYTATF